MRSAKFLWWKFFLIYGFYVLSHEMDRFFPGTIVAVVLGEGIQSIYAHMKMLFVAYLAMSIIDYFRYRKTSQPVNFFHARMLILAAVPWMMIVVYYAVEAVGITLPHIYDLTWALIMTGVGIYASMRLEEPLENTPMRQSLKNVILIFFLAALVTYVGFSFHVPDNLFIALD